MIPLGILFALVGALAIRSDSVSGGFVMPHQREQNDDGQEDQISHHKRSPSLRFATPSGAKPLKVFAPFIYFPFTVAGHRPLRRRAREISNMKQDGPESA